METTFDAQRECDKICAKFLRTDDIDEFIIECADLQHNESYICDGLADFKICVALSETMYNTKFYSMSYKFYTKADYISRVEPKILKAEPKMLEEVKERIYKLPDLFLASSARSNNKFKPN